MFERSIYTVVLPALEYTGQPDVYVFHDLRAAQAFAEAHADDKSDWPIEANFIQSFETVEAAEKARAEYEAIVAENAQ